MVSMEMYEQADAQRLSGLRIMERLHGERSLEILPELYDHARWLRDGYRFDREREYYGRAMTIIRNLQGNDSPLLAQPLRQIGNSFRVQKLPEGRGIGSLKRALEILESQPEPDTLQIARVLRDLGDWNVAFSKIGPTGDEYRRAWNLLGDVDNGEEMRAALVPRTRIRASGIPQHTWPGRRGGPRRGTGTRAGDVRRAAYGTNGEYQDPRVGTGRVEGRFQRALHRPLPVSTPSGRWRTRPGGGCRPGLHVLVHTP